MSQTHSCIIGCQAYEGPWDERETGAYIQPYTERATTNWILASSLVLFYLKEDESAALSLPVANRERAQIQPNFREDSCHHALSIERSPAASRPCFHISELVTHFFMVHLPITNLLSISC